MLGKCWSRRTDRQWSRDRPGSICDVECMPGNFFRSRVLVKHLTGSGKDKNLCDEDETYILKWTVKREDLGKRLRCFGCENKMAKQSAKHWNSLHGELSSTNIAKIARRQLEGRHLLFGVYLQTWTALYLLSVPILSRWTKQARGSAAHGPRRPSGPAARRPSSLRPGSPVAQSWFSTVFLSSGKYPCIHRSASG